MIPSDILIYDVSVNSFHFFAAIFETKKYQDEVFHSFVTISITYICRTLFLIA